MPENKRFKVYKVIGRFHEWSVEDTVDDKVVFDSIMCKYSADKVCNKLNELNDDNGELKEERDYFERKKCEYFNKYNKKHLENIQLKEENEKLQFELKECGDNKLFSRRELKKENERIKHMIQEAYETERTAIGKNVLKQLLDNI